MSDTKTGGENDVDFSVIEDQINACDRIVRQIVEGHRDPDTEESSFDTFQDLYDRVRTLSVNAFTDRYQVSGLYDALKSIFLLVAEHSGYRDKLNYTRRGKTETNDGLDNTINWFRLYAGVLLEQQPEVKYDWAIAHFKEHREDNVAHPVDIQPLRDGPDPTLVSSLVPLWYSLEDLFRLWRDVLAMDADVRDQGTAILKGEIARNGGLETHRHGFINTLNHHKDRPDQGFITGYQEGEDGKGSRFLTADVDFFPDEGDIVYFRAEQQKDDNGRPYNTLTVTDTVRLVE